MNKHTKGVWTPVELERHRSFRHFKAEEIGEYLLSVQASECHYCDPRKTLADPSGYSRVEVGIMGPDGELQGPEDVEGLPDEVVECYEGTGESGVRGVFAWVPVSCLDEIRAAIAKATKGE
ncbi:hypothetical protein LCGC14_2447240 [marine sediment metagenome]|uniref:Uncharacterized protein n=1 Tax=marine sediment metagenome TaxID=412755 RepID=A0A0F9BHH0_9ZZZZ